MQDYTVENDDRGEFISTSFGKVRVVPYSAGLGQKGVGMMTRAAVERLLTEAWVPNIKYLVAVPSQRVKGEHNIFVYGLGDMGDKLKAAECRGFLVGAGLAPRFFIPREPKPGK